MLEELGEYFFIDKYEFEYHDEQTADLYLLLKSKKEIIRIGPPLSMKKHVEAFKKQNKNTFSKGGAIQAKTKIGFSARDFIQKWKSNNMNKLKEMHVTELKII